MSNYSPFFAHDFASRCSDLLRHFYGSAIARDREVTLLLTIAAAGLVVPYERLRTASGQPLLDRQSHQAEASALQSLIGDTVAESRQFGATLRGWAGGPLASAEGAPDAWPELQTDVTLPPSMAVSQVVKCLRHALAHGNITMRGGSRIERIVFVCGYPSGHPRSAKEALRFVSAAPDDLRLFLEQWFFALSGLHITRAVLAEALDDSEAA